ncbi:MAG: PD-(D/E)XK nuclease family protein [Patescibacteria group bacterium]|nr:PD-(D/E)XK nuclease family protein [Patescibacteria group bacterium]
MLPADTLAQADPDENHRHNDPTVFSATGLLGCYRQAVLKQDHPYYVDVEGMWPAMQGTAIHAGHAAKQAPYPGALQTYRELELSVWVDTKYGRQKFVSQPDLIVVQSVEDARSIASDMYTSIYHLKIVDYKNTGEVKHDLTAARKDHVRQINMYAWLARRVMPQLLIGDVVVDELEINYGDLRKPRRFTSAGPLVTRGKLISRSPRVYEELYLEPVTIFPDEVVDAWITSAIERKIESREKLAPVLPEDEQWRCFYCPLKEVCDELAMEGL